MFLILYYLICLKILIELFWITKLVEGAPSLGSREAVEPSVSGFFKLRKIRALKKVRRERVVIQNNSIKIFNPPPLPLPLDQT